MLASWRLSSPLVMSAVLPPETSLERRLQLHQVSLLSLVLKWGVPLFVMVPKSMPDCRIRLPSSCSVDYPRVVAVQAKPYFLIASSHYLCVVLARRTFCLVVSIVFTTLQDQDPNSVMLVLHQASFFLPYCSLPCKCIVRVAACWVLSSDLPTHSQRLPPWYERHLLGSCVDLPYWPL